MDLVVDQVVELEHVRVAHRDRVREGLAGAPVEEARLAVGVGEHVAVAVGVDVAQQARQLVRLQAVEDGGGDAGAGGGGDAVGGQLAGPLLAGLDGARGVPPLVGEPAQVVLEHLPDVHAPGHAQRVEDDVDGGAVLQEGHVLDGEDLGDDALVPVAAGHLVADGDLAPLGDVDAHGLADSGVEVVLVVVELAHADDDALLAVGHAQGRVAHLAGLLAEDGAQQALLAGQLGLALGRDLPDQDVSGGDLGADADDAALVQVGQGLLGDVGDVAGDLLLAELGLAGVDLVLLDVDRG